jgi:hypothetical protein
MVKIEFKTDSSACRDIDDDIDTSEISWILDDIKHRISRGDFMGLIEDSNSNVVGEYEVIE